jgi:hypothetical protein
VSWRQGRSKSSRKELNVIALKHYLMFHHGQLQARVKPGLWQIWTAFF